MTQKSKRIHVKKLTKYHPGYKDRKLQWAKIYFDLVQGDPDFELIESEIDKWRYIMMICLELQARKPLPTDDRYWIKKGCDLENRPISLTLQMLHNFVDTTDEDEKLCTRAHARSPDKEEDKDKDIYRQLSGKIQESDRLEGIARKFYENQYPEYPKQLREWKKNPEKLIARSIEELDRLHRLDEYEYDEIAHVLEQAVRDEKFWRKNVLSLASLRKKSSNGLTKFDNMANSFDSVKPQTKEYTYECPACGITMVDHGKDLVMGCPNRKCSKENLLELIN